MHASIAREIEIKLEVPAAALKRGKGLDRDTKVATGLQLIGLSCLRHFALNERLLTVGDAEAVHQMRVALRRLRAAISIFRDLLRDQETEQLRQDLRWLTNQLGPIRDYDVLLEQRVVPMKASSTHQAELETLEAALRERRSLKLSQAQQAIAGDRGRHIVLRTALWLFGGDWTFTEDKRLRRLQQQRLSSLARRALTRQTKKVCKKLEAFTQLSPTEQHELRIAVKKLHYGAEFFETIFPGRTSRRRRFIRGLKELQAALGRLNDIRIHEEIARDIVHSRDAAPTPGNAREAFGMGLVRGSELAELGRLSGAANAAGKKLKRLPRFWD